MRRVTASALLDAWERGGSQKPAQRALALLSVACPESSSDDRAAMSIGERDAHLLALRENIFGTQCVSVTHCVACGEKLEIDFSVADVRVQKKVSGEDHHTVFLDGFDVRFRVPTSVDLLSLEEHSAPLDQRAKLFERCVTHISKDGGEVSIAAMPAAVGEAVTARMALVDPQADVLLQLSCAACGNTWQAVFDIASYLWTEIDAWAQKIFVDVHTLAATYGWHEADILAMSAQRRRRYLELIHG